MINSINNSIDMVLMNGKVLTMDSNNTITEAVAVKDGRIVMVGSNKTIKPLIAPNTQVIDLCGRSLLPGFIDVHNHFGQMAIAEFSLDLRPGISVKSIADIQGLLRECDREQAFEIEWIRGTSYDETKLAEKRHPNRWDIDQAVSDRPVILMHISGHIAVLNSKAMQAVGITEGTPAPTAGRFGRDAHGALNGMIYGEAFWRLTEYYPPLIPPPPTEKICAGIKTLGMRYLEEGITSLCDIVTYPWTFKAYQTLWKRKELPLRVAAYLRNSFFTDFAKTGLLSGFGDDYLKIGGIKFFIDGSMSGGTAAVSDSPGYTKPIYFYTQEEIKEWIKEIHQAGFQVSAHANGDIAIEIYLNALEAALQENPLNNHRTRIEHCSVVSPKIIERIKQLGALPSLFATITWFHGDKIKSYIDPEKEKWLCPFRSFLDAGIPVSGHTDYPTNPYPPRLGLYSQVCRTTRDGKLPIGTKQAISVMEALRTWTINAAYATFDEDIKGSIEKGKLADLIILDKNPLSIAPEELKELQVMMTIIGGEIRFTRKE